MSTLRAQQASEALQSMVKAEVRRRKMWGVATFEAVDAYGEEQCAAGLFEADTVPMREVLVRRQLGAREDAVVRVSERQRLMAVWVGPGDPPEGELPAAMLTPGDEDPKEAYFPKPQAFEPPALSAWDKVRGFFGAGPAAKAKRDAEEDAAEEAAAAELARVAPFAGPVELDHRAGGGLDGLDGEAILQAGLRMSDGEGDGHPAMPDGVVTGKPRGWRPRGKERRG